MSLVSLRQRWRQWVALAAGLAAAAAAAWIEQRAAPAGLALTQAQFSIAVDDPQPRAVTLPHRWADDCASCLTAWYRFDVRRPAAARITHAIYLPRVGDNAAVYLNGRLLAQGGAFTDPVARLDDRPLLASVPPALWQAGGNRLLVLLKADPAARGLLPVIHLDAEETLAAVEAQRLLWRVTVPQVAAAGAALLGLILLLLWLNRRREPLYGWLALACGAWAMHQFAALIVAPPLAAPVWDLLIGATSALAATGLWFGVRHLSWRPVRARHYLLMLLPPAALSATALAAAADSRWYGATVQLPGLALLLAVAAAALAAGWRARSALAWLLTPALPLALLAAYDLAGLAEVPPAPGVARYATTLLLAAGGWVALTRFVDSLNAAELLNIDLEALVREKTAALEQQYRRVQALESERAIAAERERLMRDMHDGVGGNLVALLAMVEAGRSAPRELAEALRSALDDLRLMIDSLDPVEGDLNAVLAMFRDRLAPKLAAAGVTLQWNVDLLPGLPDLGPARVLHILRLLQEAVTNALKHGGARTITITTPPGADEFGIDIDDDGTGFDVAQARRGRGLANMAHRAAQAGGRVEVHSVPGAGTRIALRFAAARSHSQR
jgi:signal transduction histidine kinase